MPQSAPSRQVSCFQIGTDAFSASIAYRAASNASARCGADTTTTTARLADAELADAVEQRDCGRRSASAARIPTAISPKRVSAASS